MEAGEGEQATPTREGAGSEDEDRLVRAIYIEPSRHVDERTP
jgi:hypothetical protein